ncbi:MAG: hypothetical protein CSA09_00880 [Candidatus Contendobacter odensis]|uniref:Cell division protein FtsQ n=1 Tax=Candidatus Contendibacter odensensis TaxID=1400860 RepID=A0A2G6PH04_9GAMM|nr:MAG: hypothetical protein CSA09_00880 [Candidatus Contendobacter odensis]
MRLNRGHRRGATSLKRKTRASSTAKQWMAILRPLLRWSGVVLVLAAVGFGVQVAAKKLQAPGAFPLQHVQIKGELRNLSNEDLKPIAREYLGQNFFVANLDTLRDRLAANPWVEQVSIGRWWPNIIQVNLRERIAFGYWGNDEMVDVNGQRFRPTVIRQLKKWPRLTGPNGHEKTLIQAYRETRALLEPVNLKLVKLVQDERRSWWLTFENGLEAHIGRKHFKQRLLRLADVYPRVLAAQAKYIAVIDLRYINGFAVRWKTKRPTAG